MGKGESIEVQGVVIETLPNSKFRIELGNGHRVLGHISGRTRHGFVKILSGDVVTIELSPSDLSRGRIVFKAL